jgi:hypothetical protein
MMMIRKRTLFLLVLVGSTLFAQGWISFYDGPTSGADKAAAIATDAAGNVYVTGHSTGSGSGCDYLTIKYNNRGETLWTRRYTSPGNADDSALALAVDDSGNVYVTGRACFGAHSEAVTVRYSSGGVQEWVCRIAAPSGDSNAAAKGLVLDRNRNAYICGCMSDSIGRSDYLIARITPAGTVSLVRSYNGPGDGNDTANAIAVDAAGNFYVTGASPGTGTGVDFATIKFNAAGDSTKVWRYNGPGNAGDYGRAIVLDNSGNIIVTGQSWGGSGTVYDYATIKYDPAADTVWVRRYDNPLENGVDIPAAVATDAAGNVYVTGSSEGSDYEDYATVRYSAAGARTWVARYDGPTGSSSDEARALAIPSSNTIYVTGYSESGHDNDVLTIQYDSLGAQLWTSRYDNTPHGDDQGVAIASRANGVLYVAGFSEGRNSDYDCLTIKYITHDVGVASINYPTDTITPRPVVPEVTIHNYGVFTETVAVHLWISRLSSPALYYDVQTVYGIAQGADKDVSFRYFAGDQADYAMRCSVALASDINRSNDTVTGFFSFRWHTMPAWYLNPAYVPPGPNYKFPKDGAALAFGRLDDPRQYVYCFKGNNTSEFYAYDVIGDTWQLRESIPYSFIRKKRVKKGGSLVYDRYDSLVYALKGNNTLEFWKYHAIYRAWSQENDFPLGYSGKKVKGGAGLAFWHKGAGDDYVYATKGSKTNELWGFHIQGDSWFSRNLVPMGTSLKGLGDGSAIVYTSGGVFYILKGSYNELYAYYANGDSYQTRKPLPLVGLSGKKKKARDGTALCYTGNTIYCLKGGTDEFWAYYTKADTWIQLLSIPLAPSYKPVKSGGALAYGYGYVWALKGNRSAEWWFYDPGDDKSKELEMNTDGHEWFSASSALAAAGPMLRGLTISPNPVRTEAEISAPVGVRAGLLVLYDVSGQRVWEKSVGADGPVTFDRSRFAPGVYLLRFLSDGYTAARKLVIE